MLVELLYEIVIWVAFVDCVAVLALQYNAALPISSKIKMMDCSGATD